MGVTEGWTGDDPADDVHQPGGGRQRRPEARRRGELGSPFCAGTQLGADFEVPRLRAREVRDQQRQGGVDRAASAACGELTTDHDLVVGHQYPVAEADRNCRSASVGRRKACRRQPGLDRRELSTAQISGLRNDPVGKREIDCAQARIRRTARYRAAATRAAGTRRRAARYPTASPPDRSLRRRSAAPSACPATRPSQGLPRRCSMKSSASKPAAPYVAAYHSAAVCLACRSSSSSRGGSGTPTWMNWKRRLRPCDSV